jgi:putative membrane protein
LVFAGLANASAQSSSSSTPDHEFVLDAAMANMAEIQLGHLAIKKARHAEVKKFAQMMVDDHVKALQRLADAGYGAGIPWPTKLDEKHEQIKRRLSMLSKDQFDREYMQAMVDGHREVEKMLAARGSNGGARTDESSLAAKVDQWAARTLPDVRAHLKEAEQVYASATTPGTRLP